MTLDHTEAMDPTTRFVRELDGDYFKLSEVADILGVSQRSLRLLAQGPRKDELGPSYAAYFGKVRVYLYTRDDIDKLRTYFDERNTVLPASDAPPMTGRPPKWTKEQRKERARLYSAAHYYRSRADLLRTNGDLPGARAALAKVEEAKKKLRDMG